MRRIIAKSAIYFFSFLLLLSPVSVFAMSVSSRLLGLHDLSHHTLTRLLEDIAVTTTDCTGDGPTALCVIAKANGVLMVSADAGNT